MIIIIGFNALEKRTNNLYLPNIDTQQSRKKHDKEKEINETTKSKEYNGSKKEEYEGIYYGEKTEEYFCSISDINIKSTVDDIKKAYKEEIKKYHPDKVEYLGDEFKDLAEKKAKETNKAYDYFRKIYMAYKFLQEPYIIIMKKTKVYLNILTI